ncbi:hypothetical protein EDC82_2744 [Dermacoccus sp. SAI-028]|nr:hypothetical protein EDC82_2744 [Dermacoccus sp. SAI-028]
MLARLSGEAADVDDAHVATVAPADGGFAWARTAVSNESPAGRATDGGDDADNVSRDDTDDADLTDWQRQWLDVSAPEDEPDESIPTVDAGGWWEGIPAVRQLLLTASSPPAVGAGPAHTAVTSKGHARSPRRERPRTVRYGSVERAGQAACFCSVAPMAGSASLIMSAALPRNVP